MLNNNNSNNKKNTIQDQRPNSKLLKTVQLSARMEKEAHLVKVTSKDVAAHVCGATFASSPLVKTRQS